MRDLLEKSKWLQNVARDQILLTGVGILLLGICIIGVVYLASRDSIETGLPDAAWTAEDKARALDELHVTARKQGVPQLSDQDKLRIIESIQNESAQ